MLALLILLANPLMPSASRTSWMRPESFHLLIGMSRTAALDALKAADFKAQPGVDASHMNVDYTPTQSLTLEFRKERLHSIRFELYMPAEQIGAAFDEEKKYLHATLGEPKPTKSAATLLYDNTLPNVMAVLVMKSSSPRNLSALVVRYYDPALPK